jgi:tetratricopeptide (TPR) repeat protein
MIATLTIVIQRLLQEASAAKQAANDLFASGEFEAALDKYDVALTSCPNYKHYERAVIHSNISACHLKLNCLEKAIKAASSSLEDLDKHEIELRLKPKPKPKAEQQEDSKASSGNTKDGKDASTSASDQKQHCEQGSDGLLPTNSDEAMSSTFTPSSVPDKVKNDIRRIRSKALLRRGRARSEAGGWQNLAGATEDYKTLSGMEGLTAADKHTVNSQLRTLPSRTKAAQETETAEMWGKLRQLGDGILKPFGLSTNNFQMVKDEASGGYSVNFSQGDNSSKS